MILIKTKDNQSIIRAISDSLKPPGPTKGRMLVGVSSWLKVSNKWYRWDGTGSNLVESLEIAKLFTLEEWFDHYKEDLVEFNN